MAKKPIYSQGQYIARRRISNNFGGRTPYMYYPDVFDNFQDAFNFAEDHLTLPPDAYSIEIEILDFNGNVVQGLVYEDC